MCGIVGVWNPNAETRRSVLAAGEKLGHRGPDGAGLLDTSTCIAVHRRLSIVDVKFGNQPLFSEDGQTALLYNGEIYNHRFLYADLNRPHRFATQSDGEVVLHLYEEMRESCVPKLRGMFALALWEQGVLPQSELDTDHLSTRDSTICLA